MSFARRSLLLTLAVIASTCAIGDALAAEWPEKRRFVLVEPPSQLHLYPPPSSIAEDSDGSLLVLLYWPITVGSTREVNSHAPGAHRSRRLASLPAALRGTRSCRGVSRGADHAEEILFCPTGRSCSRGYNAIDRRLPDGSIVRFAGTGRYSENSSGDGGPATAADISFAHGLSRFPDGSIVFGDRHRVRRVAPMESSPRSPAPRRLRRRWRRWRARDSGPLRGPSDVLPTEDGGFLIAETYNGRVRQVSADGVISTVAGTDKSDIFESFGDGGPATAAGLALPAALGPPSRRDAPDRRISAHPASRAGRHDQHLFELPETHGNRMVTSPGALRDDRGDGGHPRGRHRGHPRRIASACHLSRSAHTRRTLVALRDARASQRRVEVTVDATRAGRARLQILRRNRVVAHATRHFAAGRRPSPSTPLRRRIPRHPRDIARRPRRPSSRPRPPVHQRDTARATRDPNARQRYRSLQAHHRPANRLRDPRRRRRRRRPQLPGHQLLPALPERHPLPAPLRPALPPPPAPVRPHPHLDKHLERMALEMSPASPVAHLGRRHRRTSRRHSGYRQSGPSARWSGRTPRSDQPSQFSSGRPRG